MLKRCFEMLFLLGTVTLCLGCGRERVASPGPDMAAVRELREALGKESSSNEKVEEKAVGTGWASLKGQFVFTGAVGDPKALLIDKDLAVCSKDGMK
ncbi:hypothetical protein N9A92_02595, partial [Pirellulales bacterium]|nr:hypothetical protein [Pirellulales bacterium]